jgi:hypothetical protein
VEYNEIYGNSGHGIHQYYKYSMGNNGSVVRYNYVHDNGSRGILIGSGNNNVAENNLVQGNGKQSGEGGITIGFHSPENNQVYDNFIYSNRGSCIVIQRRSFNSKVKNNSCWLNDRDSVRDEGSESLVSETRVTQPADEADKVAAQFRRKYLSSRAK